MMRVIILGNRISPATSIEASDLRPIKIKPMI
ncbi:Uncharacterised protein [Vibrio cholerae]|nr:Uncharacterised protein [Vibrio cholerae]